MHASRAEGLQLHQAGMGACMGGRVWLQEVCNRVEKRCVVVLKRGAWSCVQMQTWIKGGGCSLECEDLQKKVERILVVRLQRVPGGGREAPATAWERECAAR